MKLKVSFTNLLLVLISILLTLSFLEVFARYFLSIPYLSLQINPENQDAFQSSFDEAYVIQDELLGFVPGPLWVGSGIKGFQNGKEYGEKRIGRKDVVLLGDSLLQSRNLEKALKDLLPKNLFRIWNAGIGGYNTLQEAYYLEKYIKLTPDVLILGFCLNDFSPTMTVAFQESGKKRPGQRLFDPLGSANPYFFLRSALYRFFKLRLIASSLDHKLWSPEGIKLDSYIVEKGLRMIQGYCFKNRVELVVLLFPALLESYTEKKEDIWIETAYEEVSKILLELDIQYVDLHRSFRDQNILNLKITNDDIWHPNPKGHFLAAKETINTFYLKFDLTRDQNNLIQSRKIL